MVDAKTLWQSQKTEEIVTLENIHKRAGKFQNRVRARNLREYIAAAVVVIGFSAYIWLLPGMLVKTGSALVIAGTLYVVWQLHRRGAAESLPHESEASGLVDFHRRALVRQRDALKTVWRWYLAPLVPGMALVLASPFFDAPESLRAAAARHLVLTVVLPLFVLVFGGVWLLNAWGARRLQRQIDEVDRLRPDE